jgi:deazaflavin-dependent oxidoreductase (nitroreductase family)
MAQHKANAWNSHIIDEFHANKGKVGGPFEGNTLLLLTTTGAKSGQKRTNPLVYLQEGEHMYIFATKAGAPTNPDWYHNLVAHPTVTVESGTKTFQARAVEIKGEVRDQIYAKQVQRMPGFGDYEQKTARKIPVIELLRQNG